MGHPVAHALAITEIEMSCKQANCVLSNPKSWTILPYTETPALTELAANLSAELPDCSFGLFGEDPAWMAEFGSKAILYR